MVGGIILFSVFSFQVWIYTKYRMWTDCCSNLFLHICFQSIIIKSILKNERKSHRETRGRVSKREKESVLQKKRVSCRKRDLLLLEHSQWYTTKTIILLVKPNQRILPLLLPRFVYKNYHNTVLSYFDPTTHPFLDGWQNINIRVYHFSVCITTYCPIQQSKKDEIKFVHMY